MWNRLAASLAYVVFTVLVIVWLPLMLLLAAITFPFDRNRRFVGRSLRILAKLSSSAYPGWRMRLVDVPALPSGPFIAVANHESILDVFLVSRAPWEMKWMAKASLFRIPWIGLMFRLSGDIPIDRGERSSAVKALRRARRYLERGMPVMLFPEGTRSRDGRLLPFKAGAFRLAIETGVPILPIAVHGTYGGMPVSSPWVRPTRAVARFLPFVPVTGLTVEDLPRLTEEVRAQIQRARDELAAENYAVARKSSLSPVAVTVVRRPQDLS